MTDTTTINIHFCSPEKQEWLHQVSDLCATGAIARNAIVRAEFGGVEYAEDLEPFHYVLFACFIEHCIQKECDFSHRVSSKGGLRAYMYDVLGFNRYWLEDYQYKDAADETVLNIWKVSDTEKEPHSQRIHDYFKRTYFVDRDLSALRLGLLELYYNIFDHAQAQGNAFSLLRYDEQTHKLHIAIGDMGVGIARSIRKAFPMEKDSDAIVKAMEAGVTAASQTHNAGMGLDNIVGMLFEDNTMHIVSNKGHVEIKGDKRSIETVEHEFDFPGTLIWFDVSMDRFEKEERQDNFSWDDV